MINKLRKIRFSLSQSFSLLLNLQNLQNEKMLLLSHSEFWQKSSGYFLKNRYYSKTMESYHNVSVIDINLFSLGQICLLYKNLTIKSPRNFLQNLLELMTVTLFINIKKMVFKKNSIIHDSLFRYSVTDKGNAIWDMAAKSSEVIKCNKRQNPVTFTMYCERVAPEFWNIDSNCEELIEWLTKLLLLKKISAIMAPQFSYIDQLFFFCAQNTGAEFIMCESLYSEITIYKPSHDAKYKLLVDYYKKSVDALELTGVEEKQVVEKLEKRINGNYDKLTMGYMSGVSLNSSTVSAPEGTCVLFLHCFLDGPNGFINDNTQRIYTDYFHQALSVVELVTDLKVPLLIKPHPQNKSYLGDAPLLEGLKKRVGEIKKQKKVFVEMLDETVSNASLFQLKKPFAITARGTISLECGFMGIPICMTQAHEWEQFKFIRRVKSVDDLKNYIISPYSGYDSKAARSDAVRLQYFLVNKQWSDRPRGIAVYDFKPEAVTENEMKTLYSYRLEV